MTLGVRCFPSFHFVPFRLLFQTPTLFLHPLAGLMRNLKIAALFFRVEFNRKDHGVLKVQFAPYSGLCFTPFPLH